MRTADDQRAFVVHLTQEMDGGEQRAVQRPAGIRNIISRRRPQEHDERTVSIQVILFCLITLLISNRPFYKYTKGIRTEYFLYII